ncbi:MAG: DNA topology modulation protein [Bacteroidota bacterium]
MQKVMIIGCCGAGKSTLAKRLHEQTSLPLYHLDQYYWKPNWQEPTKAEWEPIVHQLAQKKRWIIDGNYSSTLDIRLQAADTVIYLDYPTIRCLWRITKRIIKYRGQVRPDMPRGCQERFDLGFYHYVAIFNLVKRPSLLNKLDAFAKEKQVIILRNDRAVRRFLDEL